jgi:hypothetical protein
LQGQEAGDRFLFSSKLPGDRFARKKKTVTEDRAKTKKRVVFTPTKRQP